MLKKKSARGKATQKKQKLICSVCGAVMSVEDKGACPDLSEILCCGKQMKKN